MKNQPSPVELLFRKWINGQATKEEEAELLQLLGKAENEAQLDSILEDGWNGLHELIELSDEQMAAIAARATGVVPLHHAAPPGKVRHRGRWWAAASAILIIGLATFLLTRNSHPAKPDTVQMASNEILPGKEGAVLTLADGAQLVLDSLGNGVIAAQNGTQVKLMDGHLAYEAATANVSEIAYNTLTTPNGRTFRIMLPDGTNVWLNAASSIRYPTAFAGNERKVTITGEAYFEVAPDKKLPFRVNVNNKAAIEVLGTHFNVNAYNNEPAIHTTLLEGSVKVSTADGQPAVLKPGQQAVVKQGDLLTIHNNANIDKVMAWKNGLFNFQDVPLKEAMRQLERWYDIEVLYEGDIPDVQLVGEMTKDVTLNDLLVLLDKIRVKCRLEGRKMIVSK